MAGQGRPEPTLLLTRPRAASERFLSALEARAGRRLPAVISPLLEIRPMDERPELGDFDTLVLTSANAVAMLRDADDLKGRRVRTVGERAAAEARAAGAQAECLGETVDDFVARADVAGDWGRAVHLRGVHARGDLALRLCDKGICCDELVVYDQVSCPLTRAAATLLASSAAVVLPLFSPRSAQLAARAVPGDARPTIVAISAATARAWDRPADIHVADAPTAEAMQTATYRAFQGPNLGGTPAAH